MKFTEVIKKYGYKLIDVERDLGYSNGSLRTIFVKVRTGIQKSIGTDIIYRIADHIGCHPAEFFLDDPTTFRGQVIEHDIPLPNKQIKKEEDNVKQPVLDIRYAMKQLHIKQKDLAKMLDVSEVGMLYMLNNKSISLERLYQIANALGVKVTDLFVEPNE